MRALLTFSFALMVSLPVAARAEENPDLLQEIEQHFHAAHKWFGMVADLEWDRDAAGGLTPRLSTEHSGFVLKTDPAGQRLGARLPPTASGAFTVWVEGLDGFQVHTEELNVRPVPAELLRGMVIYRGALAGGDLLYKLTPTHVDEYLYLRQPPATLRREIELDVGKGVARLRQAGRLVEVLAKDGTARLRLSAPVARAADGTRRVGTVHVDGQRIIEELDLRGLATPVLVDPDWSTTGTMTVAHWADYGFRRADGTVMAVGGCALASCPIGLATSACNQVLASVDLWSESSGVWTAGPPLSVARYSYAGIPLSNGDLLAVGGCLASGCTAVSGVAERWHADSDSWTAAGTLSGGRGNLTGAPLANGDALVVGGCDPNACHADAWTYSALANTWSAASALATARGYHTTTALSDGRVLVVGGCSDPTCGTVLDTAELFDPATGQWTPAGTMGSARAGHTATLLGDGSVLITGGCSTQSCRTTTLTSTELWRAAGANGGAFSPGPQMNAPRHHHTATLMANGEVLVAGGADGDDATRAASDVYLPISERFYRAPRMMMSRAYHVSVGLPDGKVLVGGGCNPATCLPWAEVFSPEGLPVEVPDGGPVDIDAGPEPPDPVFDAGPPFPVVATPHPKLFRSGSVACSNDETQDQVCPVAGWSAQDGEYQPNARPKEPSGNEVKDPVTGLTWAGLDLDGLHTQTEAIQACADFSTSSAKAGEWRLPSVIELMTVIDYGKIGPSVDQAFSIQQTNYWTSTGVAGSTLLAWTVKFDAGEVLPLLHDTPLPVRCVRGTFTPAQAKDHLRLAGPLVAASNDVVRDDANGLEWQRRDDGVKRSWRESLDYCAHLQLAGHSDWHLANVYELFSLVEFGTSEKVKIDPLFDGTKGDLYWTGSYGEGIPTLSWGITFNLGVVDGVTVSGKALARCVRHVQPPKSNNCGCGGGEGAVPVVVLLLALRLRRRSRQTH